MTKRSERLWLLAVILCGVGAYGSALRASFTVDDFASIVGNRAVEGRLSLSSLFGLDWFGRPFSGSLGWHRPVATLTFWIDQHLGNGAPIAFHATNLALYAALLVLCDQFLRRLSRDALSAPMRLLALATFATLTIHADVVPTASAGRCELLAALFSVAGLHAAIDPRPTQRAPVIVGVCLLFALFSKESTLPIAILAAVLAFRRIDRRRAIAVSLASGGALIAFMAFRFVRLPLAIRAQWAVQNPLIGQPLGTRLLGAAEVLSHYLQHVVAPVDLSYDYGYAAIVPGPGPTLRAAAGLALAVALTAWLVVSFGRRSPVADALLGFGASYIGVSHVIVPASAILADRWFFFPSFWLVSAAAMSVDEVVTETRRRLVVVLGLAFAAGQGLTTAAFATVWYSDARLANYSVHAHPNAMGPRFLQAASASWEHRDDDAAWALLAAYAIYGSFPLPVAEDAIPLEWENAPPHHRVEKLREKIGPNAFVLALDSAIREAVKRGYDDVARSLFVIRGHT